MTLRTVVLSCVLSVFASLPARAQVGEVKPGPKETTISATGTARVERAPDYVDVMVGSVAIEKSAGTAHGTASKAMDEAVAAIKGLKLAGEDLQTGSVDLSPRYERKERYDDDVPKIVGYVATVTLRVRTSDLKAVPRIIDSALSAGCNRVDYVQFGIKEAIAAREEAVKLATQAAKRKASVMAEALDLKITRVVEASTASHQAGGWYRGNAISQMANAATPAEPGSGEDSVVPGKIEVWADATVVFGAGNK
jgi:uncharacterized protein YggE